ENLNLKQNSRFELLHYVARYLSHIHLCFLTWVRCSKMENMFNALLWDKSIGLHLVKSVKKRRLPS
ncbi:hypothetical protein DND62_30545, partial [Pseudomonas syringae pv. pisi]